MHEHGIVMHTAKTITEFAEENGIGEISAVVLEIGEVSGIMYEEFSNCWNYFRKRYPVLAESELKIEVTPAVTWCNSCESTYETVRYGRTCPHCGSGETWLLTGNECTIKEIEVPE